MEFPVIAFFTGSHEDYHRPTDTPEKINYDGLVRITTFAKGLIGDLLQSPGRPGLPQGCAERWTRRFTRGICAPIWEPSRITPPEVAGVKISGVRGGSPAEKGGLQDGDIIVEFGGQKVANIYDYYLRPGCSKNWTAGENCRPPEGGKGSVNGNARNSEVIDSSIFTPHS